MKKYIFISLVLLNLFQCLSAYAQVNLVANPSFEDTIHCPNGAGRMIIPASCENWYEPAYGSSDYFNSCTSNIVGVPSNFAGWQYAHSGVAYAGFLSYPAGREYIQEKIDSTLLPNHKYCVQFYVGLCNILNIATNNIGMYISDSVPIPPVSPNPYAYIPQINDTSIISDTAGWTMVSGIYIAHGGEQYITIGNFFTDANTDTIYIAHHTNANGAYYYIDDVSIVDCTLTAGETELGIKNDELGVYPNPNDGEFSINLNKEYKSVEIEITNIIGQTMFALKEKETNLINLTLNQPPGLYFVTVIADERKQVLKLVKE